jgi:type IV pilus assembly protein PilW
MIMGSTRKLMSPRRQAGLSLVELMVSIAIGLLLLTGLVTYFVDASQAQRELQKSAQQLESGRYALDTLTQDLHLVGFYGAYSAYTTPASLPDPCTVTTTTNISAGMALPIQGYQAASLTAEPTLSTDCALLIPSANLAEGSDVLVVRFMESTPVSTASGTTVATATYAQTNPVTALVQVGGATVTCTTDALGAATTVTRKCTVPTAIDACATECGAGTSPGGDIRQLRVHIYYVSPCSVPATGTTCTAAADGGVPIPTLKRLELTAAAFTVSSIAEGVEYMKIEYAVDDTPATVNGNTGLIGDGVPDRYTLTPTLADFANAVSVRVDLLVRNPQPSPGHNDIKTYKLGVNPIVLTNAAFTAGPFNDSYRRHVYAGEVRLVNLAGRKEIP